MNRTASRVLGVALACGFLMSVGGCRRSSTPAGALKKKPGEKVAKIVFVGQKDACECTKKRVQETWNALQFALKKHQGVKVERIARDVQKDRAQKLKNKRRYMVMPALYFFSPEGKLVAMLEGELKPDQISKNIE